MSNPRWNPYQEYSEYYTVQCNGLCFEDGQNDWFDHEEEIHQQLLALWLGLTEGECSCCIWAEREQEELDDIGGIPYCKCVCHKKVKDQMSLPQPLDIFWGLVSLADYCLRLDGWFYASMCCILMSIYWYYNLSPLSGILAITAAMLFLVINLYDAFERLGELSEGMKTK